MQCYWLGCTGNLKFITFGSDRVKKRHRGNTLVNIWGFKCTSCNRYIRIRVRLGQGLRTSKAFLPRLSRENENERNHDDRDTCSLNLYWRAHQCGVDRRHDAVHSSHAWYGVGAVAQQQMRRQLRSQPAARTSGHMTGFHQWRAREHWWLS